MTPPAIFIVEDEAIVAADLAGKLRQLGYAVSGATARGEDAVSLARQQRPDLVLMDIRLAGRMDGIEAADQIRTKCGLPVIYLTAHSDNAILQRAKLTEPFGYITKPFEERELRTQIEMALHKHQVDQKLRISEERLRQLNSKLEQRVLERTCQLRALAAELVLAEERERRRIAQILHDRLQPLLVASRLQVEAASASRNPATQRKCLRKTCGFLDQSARVTHELGHELSPPVLNDFGLSESLRWLVTWMRETHGLSVRLLAEGEGPAVPEDFKLLLFHSVRELLFNVVKHSGVKRASVSLVHNGGQHVEVLVRDRGKGFDTRRITKHAVGDGLGLFSIRERLRQMGGRMEIESKPNHGSEVRLIAPL